MIGLALLCMACGALVAMPLTGQVLATRPSARVTQIAVLVECVLIPLPLLAPSPWLLGAFLLVFGAANGATDVAMNAHGIAVEKRVGRSIMSSLHAGWSVGGLTAAGRRGAGRGRRAGRARRGLDRRRRAVRVRRGSEPAARDGDAAAEAGPAPKLARPPRGVVLLGVLCLRSWSPRARWATGAASTCATRSAPTRASPPIGFAGFSAGMAGGRFFGDWLADRLGTGTVLRARRRAGHVRARRAAAGRRPGGGRDRLHARRARRLQRRAAAVQRRRPRAGDVSAPALAAVFTMGYMGFIAGPPVIGILADLVSLPAALALLCLASGSVVVFGGRATHAAEPLSAVRRARPRLELPVVPGDAVALDELERDALGDLRAEALQHRRGVDALGRVARARARRRTPRASPDRGG